MNNKSTFQKALEEYQSKEASILRRNEKLIQAPELTWRESIKQKIKGFFDPMVTFFTGLEPRERPQIIKHPITKEKITIPSFLPLPEKRGLFKKEPTQVPISPDKEVFLIPQKIWNYTLEVIPKAALQMIQNYRDLGKPETPITMPGEKTWEAGAAPPLKLPFDARRLGFDKPEIESTGRKLVDKFNELNAIDPPKGSWDDPTIWKNAVLASLMVVVPDTIDIFVAANTLELGGKVLLKVTKYDPVLERSMSELGLSRKDLSPATILDRTKKSMQASKTITEYADSLRAGAYITGKVKGEGVLITNKFITKIQNAAKDLILPLEQYGKGFQVRPIAAYPGLPGYARTRAGLAITPRISMLKTADVHILAKKGLDPKAIAKQLGLTEPVVKSVLGIGVKIPIEDITAKLSKAIIKASPIPIEVVEKEKAKFIATTAKELAKIKQEYPELYVAKLDAMELDAIEGTIFSFDAPKTQFSKVERDNLIKEIKENPNFNILQKRQATSGLNQLFEGKIPSKEKLGLLGDVYGLDLVKDVLTKRPRGKKIWDTFIELYNIPRLLMTTGEMSGLLRQTVIPAFSHPVLTIKAFKKSLGYGFSQKKMDAFFEGIKKEPLYNLMRDTKLGLTDPKTPILGDREEKFISQILQTKVPIIGTWFIKGYERAYVGLLNRVRVDLFKQQAERLRLIGKDPTSADNIKLFEEMSRSINNITGRGDLPLDLNKIAPLLSTTFFAPRLAMANLQVFNPGRYIKLALDPKTRPIAKNDMWNMVKFVSVGLTILGAFKIYKDAFDIPDEELTVDLDYKNPSADFGKIKVGNTRFDIWGGKQQVVRLGLNMITGRSKSTTSGNIVTLDGETFPFDTRTDVLLRFWGNKLAPVPAELKRWVLDGGKTFEGDDTTISNSAWNLLMPLYFQDMWDAYEDAGLKGVLPVMGAGFFGIGVSTYKRKLKPGKIPGLKGLDKLPGLEKSGLDKLPGL